MTYPNPQQNARTAPLTYKLNASNARDLGSNSYIDQKGAYAGHFTRAEAVTSAKGTKGVEFDFVTADGRAHANYLTLWVEGATGNELFGRKVLDGILTCLQVREVKTAEAMVKRRNFETREDEQVRAVVFPGLMNKPIGVVLIREETITQKGTSRWRNVIALPFEAGTRRLPAEVLDNTPPQGLERVLANLRDKPLRDGEAGPNFGRPASSGDGPAPDFAPHGGGASGFDDMQDIPF